MRHSPRRSGDVFRLVLFIPLALTVTSGLLAKDKEKPYVEVVGILGTGSSLVELKDGSLLANDGRVSTDGGLTWGKPRPLGGARLSAAGIMRLNSGELMLAESNDTGLARLWISEDEGKTWRIQGAVKTLEPKGSFVTNYFDPMIQLKSGRLLFPWDTTFVSDHVGMSYSAMMAKGTWKGRSYDLEGHQHLPEQFATVLSYSDDLGRTWEYETWQGSVVAMMGWFDFKGEVNGMAGNTMFVETTMAECSDGRVLWVGRSSVGRVVFSYSNDQGKSWDPVRPADLAGSGSPVRVQRIPKTGDLLLVWNQVSRKEIEEGFRRGRLSAAISKDCGRTWQNFKTIEVSEGLKDVARVPAEFPIQMVRARQHVGKIPDGFKYFHYANVCFAGEKVYILYNRGGPILGTAEQMLERQDPVLRIYPLKWFYE